MGASAIETSPAHPSIHVILGEMQEREHGLPAMHGPAKVPDMLLMAQGEGGCFEGAVCCSIADLPVGPCEVPNEVKGKLHAAVVTAMGADKARSYLATLSLLAAVTRDHAAAAQAQAKLALSKCTSRAGQKEAQLSTLGML